MPVRRNTFFARGIHFFFKKTLLVTNSLTSGACMALGDLMQQEFEYQTQKLPERYDWQRITHMFTVGTCIGPLHHYYYWYLDKLLPSNNVRTVAIKIFCDQTIASPLTILAFFYGMGVLQQKTFAQSTEEIKTKFKYVYLGDCLYWPPVQYINFYYLPREYRVIYINFATMIFNVYLSCMKFYDHKHKEKE